MTDKKLRDENSWNNISFPDYARAEMLFAW